MKHSLDVDHLAAVTTMLPGRRRRWQAARVGAWWGLGHAVTLMAVGGVIIAFDLTFPPAVSLALEFGVGLMLIVLGLRLLIRLRRGWTVHLHAHSHGERLHIHPHVHSEEVRHDERASRVLAPAPECQAAPRAPRAPGDTKAPFFVGMIHGLAGSAGLTLSSFR